MKMSVRVTVSEDLQYVKDAGRLTADVVARAGIIVTTCGAKVQLPAVALVNNEIWVSVRILALDEYLLQHR